MEHSMRSMSRTCYAALGSFSSSCPHSACYSNLAHDMLNGASTSFVTRRVVLRLHKAANTVQCRNKHSSMADNAEGKRIATSKRGGPVWEYMVQHSLRDNPHLTKLQEVTMQHPRLGMCSPQDSIPILQMLARLTHAKRIIEVGVFTGYATLGMALALPPDGQLIACDVSRDYTSIGQPHWEAAGVADRIDLRIAPAAQTLEAMLEDGKEGTVDLAFIDADKPAYGQYYELLLRLLRPGGVIAVDNVLWSGKVADDSIQDEDTNAIRELNAKIIQDDRVDVCMLSNSDGITVVRKR